MSRDIPIIFSAPMVLAHREGRKTMTRRLAWREGWYCACDGRGVTSKKFNPSGIRVCAKCGASGGLIFRRAPTPWQDVKLNDRLYVRESHWRWGRWKYESSHVERERRWHFYPERETPDSINFDVEPPGRQGSKMEHDQLRWWKRPSIFHPRHLSRLTNLVIGTKVEPLLKISDTDAIAEGIVQDPDGTFAIPGTPWRGFQTAVFAFDWLWRSLHGVDSWVSNPEVVALSYEVHHRNIDSPLLGSRLDFDRRAREVLLS